MKKFAIHILLLAALVACSEGQESLNQGEPIAFACAFEEDTILDAEKNRTRATTDISSFMVWGTANNVLIYNDNTVSNGSGVWICDKQQFWVPDAEYKFTAVSGINAANVTDEDQFGMPTELTYDSEAQTDMCYAKATAKGKHTGNEKVNFKFSHTLSRLGFTMDASVEKTAITSVVQARFKVTNITLSPISGASGLFYKSATFDLNSSSYKWNTNNSQLGDSIVMTSDSFSADNNSGLKLTQTENEGSVQVNADNKFIMLIPQNLSANGFNVSIEYEVTLFGKNKDTNEYDVEYNRYTKSGGGTVKLNFEQNKAYMIKLNVDLNEVTIDENVSMTKWEEVDEIIIDGIVQ